LEEYNIKTNNIDINLVPDSLKDFFEKKRDCDGKIKSGLRNDYMLLKDLNDDLGHKYQTLDNHLQKRNNSILAHGFETISKEEARNFFDKLLDIIAQEIKDFHIIRNGLKFPKLASS